MKKKLSDSILYNYGAMRRAIPFLIRRPLGFFLYITGRCNLRCPYCWQRQDEIRKNEWIDSTKNEMSPEEWVSVIDKLPKPSFVGLSGGEASLSNAFRPILKAASKRAIPVTVNTNGRAFHGGAMESMLRYGVKNVSVSLDGFAEMHDAGRNMPGLFNDIVAGIKRFNTHRTTSKIKLTIKSVLFNENLDKLKQFHKFCESELRADTLNISFAKKGDHAQFSLKYTESTDQLFINKSEVLYKYTSPNNVRNVLTNLLANNRRHRCKVTLYPQMDSKGIDPFIRNSGHGVYKRCTLPWALNVALPNGQVIPCLSTGLGSLRNNNYDFYPIVVGEKSRAFLNRIETMGNNLPSACDACCFLQVDTANKR